MTPSEVRKRFLFDHAQLRGKAAVLETLALHVLRGDEDLASALQLKGEEVQEHLLSHMHWEESHIVPLLRDQAVARSAEMFLSEHESQRRALRDWLVALHDSNVRSPELARQMLDFVSWLERDMDAEECYLLAVVDFKEPAKPEP